MQNLTKHKQIDICDSANSNLVHLEDAITHEQIATFNKGSHEEKIANALYAMTAWNLHEELLEALEEALIDLENFKEPSLSNDIHEIGGIKDHPTVARVKAALSKAKGE